MRLLFFGNMAEYFCDSEVVDDDFVYDGRPHRFEPEYTDEELVERRMWMLAKEQQTAARPRVEGNWWFLWTMFIDDYRGGMPLLLRVGLEARRLASGCVNRRIDALLISIKDIYAAVLTTECDHVGAKAMYFPDRDRLVRLGLVTTRVNAEDK